MISGKWRGTSGPHSLSTLGKKSRTLTTSRVGYSEERGSVLLPSHSLWRRSGRRNGTRGRKGDGYPASSPRGPGKGKH